MVACMQVATAPCAGLPTAAHSSRQSHLLTTAGQCLSPAECAQQGTSSDGCTAAAAGAEATAGGAAA